MALPEIINITSQSLSTINLQKIILKEEVEESKKPSVDIVVTQNQDCIKIASPCPLKADFEAALQDIQKRQHQHNNLNLLDTITAQDIERWNDQSSASLIKSIDPEVFALTSGSQLTLKELPISKISGLPEIVEQMEEFKLPGVADEHTLGLVRSTAPQLDALGNVINKEAVENKVKINEDGSMEVNSLSINKLVQDDSTELIIDSSIN